MTAARTCSICGGGYEVPYPSTRRYTCSEPCRREMQRRSAVHTNAGKETRRSDWITTPCYGCGTPVERPPWEARQRNRAYCSKACSTQFAPKPGGRPHRVTTPRYTDSTGYIRVYLPYEERPAGWTHSHYPEHRQVMRQILGRDLQPFENVHHINGDKTDNRPENLELWVSKQPKGQRVEDLLAWAREVVALYG